MGGGIEARPGAGVAGGDRRLGWKVFGVLMVGGVIGSLALVPYSISLLGQGESLEVPTWAVVVGAVVQGLLFTAIAAGLGLWLGGKVGLGTPELRAWLAGDSEAPRRILVTLPLAVGLGLAVGVVVVLLGAASTPLMPESLQEVVLPSPWQGLLASVGAGITEEIWLRLGLMTLLIWIGAKLTRRERPAAWVVWVSIVLATLLFGAMHLPQAAALGEGLTGALVALVLFGNGILGVVFGWLYWKRGLIAAMVAHFSTDIVLKVIVPAIGSMVPA